MLEELAGSAGGLVAGTTQVRVTLQARHGFSGALVRIGDTDRRVDAVVQVISAESYVATDPVNTVLAANCGHVQGWRVHPTTMDDASPEVALGEPSPFVQTLWMNQRIDGVTPEFYSRNWYIHGGHPDGQDAETDESRANRKEMEARGMQRWYIQNRVLEPITPTAWVINGFADLTFPSLPPGHRRAVRPEGRVRRRALRPLAAAGDPGCRVPGGLSHDQGDTRQRRPRRSPSTPRTRPTRWIPSCTGCSSRRSTTPGPAASTRRRSRTARSWTHSPRTRGASRSSTGARDGSAAALQLNDGTRNAKVALPEGIVGDLTECTIAAWINPTERAAVRQGLRLRKRSDRHRLLQPRRARTCRSLASTQYLGGGSGPGPSFVISVDGKKEALNAPDPLPAR